MFQTLTQNLTKIFDKIKGAGALTEAHIDSAMRDIRIALLEADVALPVVRAFISEVSEKAKGVEVVKSVSPAQMVIKIINDEMIRLLQPDENESKINLQSVPPVNLLIVGLQGSGKTTASAKLALKLKSTGKKVLLVSLDTYRPAAQDQLEILAKSIEVDSLPIIKEQLPIAITERAITAAKLSGYDVVIYDTAGRLHIDDDMINEAIKVKSLVKPTETFLVMDAKPIKFLSTGEKPDEFEEFDAKRIASRILDMGDVVSFVERAASVIDRSEAEKTAAKLKKGQFDLDDYISQIKMIKKMGGLGSMMNFLPGISKLSDKIGDLSSGEKALVSQMAIVNSMTKKERKNPDILNASRKKRVATGSGTTVQQVNILLKQFKQISTTMKKVSRMNPKTLLRSGIGKLFS